MTNVQFQLVEKMSDKELKAYFLGFCMANNHAPTEEEQELALSGAKLAILSRQSK